jgi:enamine deaminase RidA (YjgF/YER057c/UK114 family)
VRSEVLANRARSTSSSFIDPGRFESQASIALDLLAMRPTDPATPKTLQEYEPPRPPLRYLGWDSLVFLSGETCAQGALEEQVATILGSMGGTLTHAGTSWERAVLVSCFLHTSQQVPVLQQLVRQAVPIGAARLECEQVEGYANVGPLLEIEVTALR